MRYLFTSLLCCCFAVALRAQEKSLFQKLITKPKYDSNYVESYYEKFLHVTLVSLRPNHRITISDFANNQKVSLRPNTRASYGFGLDYKYFTIELSKAFGALSKTDPNKGTTESFSLRVGYTGRRVLASALIQSYQGMYISNPESVIPNWDLNANGYPKRADIQSTILFGSLNYFFNHVRYSTMASLWQIDRQKRSSGSAVLGITASQSTLSGDSALAPQGNLRTYNPNERIKRGTNYLAGVNFGYAYNLIFKKKIFFNVFFIPGFNLQYGEYETNNNQTRHYSSNLGVHGDLRLIGGYNGERYYYGIHYSNYFFQNNLETNLDINSFNSYLRLFVGTRFDLSRKKK
jgi:hypothetical protein